MELLKEISKCKICKDSLPFPPKPVLSFSTTSRIIVIGQAPGTRVHKTGIPWNDPSGDRLREWLDIDRRDFYNTKLFGITPMGFCYPGKGKSGDLPPRPECAPKWMPSIFKTLKRYELVLLIGQYAQKYFLKDRMKSTLTETVRNWKEYLPEFFVLPHPSPRNNIWLKKNPWFEKRAVPALRSVTHRVLKDV